MAPSFKAGKGQVLLFNNVNMGTVTNSASFEATADALDTTVFGVSDRTKIAGLRDGSFAAEGLFDGTALSTASTATTGAFDERFGSALGSTSAPIVTYSPDSTAIGGRVRMIKAVGTKYAVQSPANDVVKWAADAQLAERQDYGVWLHPLATRTSTSSTFASFDSAIDAGTTAGGVAHLHVTADSTLTSVVVKIQHSTAVSASTATWADLITFSSFDESTGATAAQRSTASGTVGRRTRAIISTFTGGASKSATLAVAFARRHAPR